MKIAIIGTRGIPNRYGGFEQLAEKLSVGLSKKGHAVTVYNSHKHPYHAKKFMDVDIVHRFDAEYRLGTAGQFIYDLNCVRDARKRKFDLLLFLGYTSSSIWGRLFPKKPVIISNMDGMEWKRSKYRKTTQHFLQYAEKLAVKYSDHLIADSVVIRSYLEGKYHKDIEFIPYGADIFTDENETHLSAFGLSTLNYFMLMARMEPENNIEMILDGFNESSTNKKFIVIGNTANSFGKRMVEKFSGDERILFAGPLYDSAILHSLKCFCSLYFHGHSTGGTNPSLLEAMASRALIAAHDNAFNRAVLQDDAFYFAGKEGVKDLIASVDAGSDADEKRANNLQKIKEQYNWPTIIDQYEALMTNCYKQAKA